MPGSDRKVRIGWNWPLGELYGFDIEPKLSYRRLSLLEWKDRQHSAL